MGWAELAWAGQVVLGELCSKISQLRATIRSPPRSEPVKQRVSAIERDLAPPVFARRLRWEGEKEFFFHWRVGVSAVLKKKTRFAKHPGTGGLRSTLRVC